MERLFSHVNGDHVTERPSVAVYSRLARDDGQRSWDAMERQQQACAASATRIGAHVVASFVDLGQSGTSTDRPGLNYLFAYAEEQPIDYLAVSSIDRLARKPKHLDYLLMRLHKLGTRVLTADSDTAIELVLPPDLEVLNGDPILGGRDE